MFKKQLLLFSALFIALQISAQDLLSPSFDFSFKKTSYVTLNDGSEIKGTLKGVKRKKGLIKFISIKDVNGEKHKLMPENVKYMYLMPNRLDRIAKGINVLTDAQKWNDEKLEQDLLNQGYVYFENAAVKVKKKQMTLLMQLLNPGFSKKVKVYHDPYADETRSLGIAGVKVAGGIAKSYYIQIGEDAAYKLEKKVYKKEFAPLWDKCAKVKENSPQVKWADLTKHIIDFSSCD